MDNLIRFKVENGIVPKGLTANQIFESLKRSKKPNVFEAFGVLSAKKISGGESTDLGVISVEKVTVAFANYIVDSLQNSTTAPMDVFEYHASGTGTTAESNTDTALVTEVESRVTGTQTEGASANIYQSVGTVTYTGTHAITEHGLFSAATAGTLMDRSVFTAVNVESSDQIEFTYQLTVNAEA